MPRQAAKKAEAEQATATVDAMLLSEIHDATLHKDEPTNYQFVSEKDVGLMVNLGYVITNANVTNGQGNIAAKITQAGVQWLRENTPNLITQETEQVEQVEQPTQTQNQTMNTETQTEAAVKRARPVVSGIVSNVDLPDVESRRGGARPETYPFSKMEVGQSFFIQATDEVPDPMKSYASTVASATNRYAEEIPGETRETRKGNVVPKTKPTRVFKLIRVEDGAPFGAQFAGKPGAAVKRVQ